MVEQVISGGQTGVDQMALEVARSLGIPTGGMAPKGYLTEDGPNEQLRDYGLVEHPSVRYAARTRANVQQSDGTVLFGDMTGGTKLTLTTCLKEKKLHLINPTAAELSIWLTAHQIRILNVAGNRGSSLTVEQSKGYRRVLEQVLS